jgi:hypothetical protein
VRRTATASTPAPRPANLDEVPNVRDLDFNFETGQADVTTRGNLGWKANAATLKDGSLEFEMVYDPTDADYQAFLGAWIKGTTIAVAALDGDKGTSGTIGVWFDAVVTNFSKEEHLEDAQKTKVTLKPAYSTVAPEIVKVS